MIAILSLIAFALAAAADARSTDLFVQRGNREGWAAWLIGKHPSRLRCWVMLFAVPTAAMAALLYADPSFWFIPLFYAVVRVAVARKNWRMRAHE